MPEGARIVIRKNRKRALWSLAIIVFMIPVSGWLLYAGLQPGRPEVAWAMVAFGILAIGAFSASAASVIHTMRSPWHVGVTPSCLELTTKAYRLAIPWERVAGIAVDVVDRRPGCVLVFDDPVAVSLGADFAVGANHRDAVTGPEVMQRRMAHNYRQGGYHLGIPGRLLEMGPEELAQILARARTGELWQEGAWQE